MPLRRILVTGAGGFVGRHLLACLAETHPDAELLTPGFDVTDAEAARQAVAAARPDAVAHLAGVAAPADARRDPDRGWSVNLHGTLHLARAVMAEAPGAVFLSAGSADAYGASFRSGQPLDETAPLAPQNTYGATKAAADLALGAMAAEGLRAIRARPFNHTGPGQTDAFVVPAFARQVAAIEAGRQAPVMQVGSLDPRRDFLDVRDVCRAYALALSAELAPGTVLNLASGTARRIGDVLQALLDLAGVRAELRTDAARLRPSDIAVAHGDAGLARRVLGWEPRIAWQTTLADVLADWRHRVREAG
jgi:GDP-4-dehydro-6-deoxy-D-mannose reductase